MARKKEIDNGYRPPFLLSAKAVGMACSCVQNHTCTQYSFCVSLSGCLSAHVSDNPQGAAIGENIFQHFVLSTIAGLSSREQSLKGSNRYTLRHGRRIISADHPSPSLKDTESCVSLSGCMPSRVADNPQGAAIGENIFQHFVLSTIAGLSSREQSLKGSNRYTLRHSRRIIPAEHLSSSLKGSNRYTLRHGRRIIPSDHPSPSLKGSDRDCPMAQPLNLHTTKTF